MDKTETPFFMNFEARKNMSRKEIVDMFSEGAPLFDKEYIRRQHTGPSLVAATVSEHFEASRRSVVRVVDVADTVSEHFEASRRSVVRVVDVAGGTGMVAEALYDRGFTNIDWLDPSEGMKNEALKKNVYTNFLLEFMDGNRIQAIPTDTYDCLTITAGLNEGLIPCVAFKEMVRIVKPGGIICFGRTKFYQDLTSEYKRKLGPLLERMEEEGIWECLSKREYKDYFEEDKTGQVDCYKVKVSTHP